MKKNITISKKNLTGRIAEVRKSKFDGGPLFARINGDDGIKYTVPDFDYPTNTLLCQGMRVSFSLYETGLHTNATDVRLVS